ncbi:MAG: hypothetical protein KGS72_07480 [Cyanobacteria bacterium REEB67]|nr:hypothetical protein [Cyanobacteria bacterium REEB67]
MLDEKSLQTHSRPAFESTAVPLERHSAREGARQFCLPEEDLSGRSPTGAVVESGANKVNESALAYQPATGPKWSEQASTRQNLPQPDLHSDRPAPAYCDDIPATKWHTLAIRLAIVSVAVGSSFPYFLVHLLGGHFNDLFCGPSLDVYMHTSAHASAIGLLLTVCGYAGLLRSFANVKASRTVIVVRGLFVAALLLYSVHFYGAAGVVIATACCLSWLGLMRLGRGVRQALPESFRHKRTVAAIGFASLPVALITLAGIYTACTTHHPPGYVSHYTDIVAGDLPLIMGFMALVLALPAYAVARCARTSAVKPLIALTLLVHSPLLIGLTLQTVLMTGAGVAWQSIFGMIAALLCATLSLSAGAILAAVTNRRQHLALTFNNNARPYF